MCADFGEQVSADNVFSIYLLTGITLEDGTQYVFTYDTGTTGLHEGRLLSVTLPTGGIVSIGYGAFGIPRVEFANQSVSSVTFSGATWNLSYAWNSSTAQVTTTVMSPLRYDSASNSNISDKTVFTSISNNAVNGTAQYYSGSSTLLRTVNTTYGQFLLPSSITTTLSDTGQSSSVSYPSYFQNLRNYPTKKQETDFAGTVVRTTTYSYGPGLKPTSINVYAGSSTSGTPISSTLYAYDEYSANYCKNGVPMLTTVTGAYHHDDTYGNSGNATTTQRLISGTTYATTHACYDTLGNVTQTVDANGNPSSYNYTDNWVDSSCIPSGTLVHGYPTTITDALGHQATHSNFTCGVLTQSTKDQNDINAGRPGTTYTYDIFKRPAFINYPDGGQTTYCYSHDPNSSCYTSALPPFSTESRLMSGTTTLNTKTLLDSYSRVSETQLTSDPDCASGDKTDTTYDNLGRVLTVSNPYCSTSDPTYGLTTYSYDALGRVTKVAHQDGASAATSYLGSATQVQDEGNGTQCVARISQVDGLGHLVSVCEVAPGPFVGSGGTSSSSLIGSGSSGTPTSCGQDINATGFLTTYQYDTLDNLLQVNQSGITARTFTYDSLSRLLTSSNPESGSISYSYDANGNLSTKTSPAPNQTGSGTITTTYQYDALNRLTQKSYNDSPTTPTVTFTYDQGYVTYKTWSAACTKAPSVLTFTLKIVTTPWAA